MAYISPNRIAGIIIFGTILALTAEFKKVIFFFFSEIIWKDSHLEDKASNVSFGFQFS